LNKILCKNIVIHLIDILEVTVTVQQCQLLVFGPVGSCGVTYLAEEVGPSGNSKLNSGRTETPLATKGFAWFPSVYPEKCWHITLNYVTTSSFHAILGSFVYSYSDDI
jgi:hypothetical protein